MRVAERDRQHVCSILFFGTRATAEIAVLGQTTVSLTDGMGLVN